MSLDDFARRKLNSPDMYEGDKKNIQALLSSHLAAGRKHEDDGALHKAIEEYAREHSRPVQSDIDAEIVQKSYWHVGAVYRKLGDLPNAISAFQKARELLQRHSVGASPHGELAEILIEQGKYDEAIEVCQEWLQDSRSGWAKQLLAKATALKGGQTG